VPITGGCGAKCRWWRGATRVVDGELWAAEHMCVACGGAVCGCVRLRLFVACVALDFECFCDAWCM
jgi:hypothetical protein